MTENHNAGIAHEPFRVFEISDPITQANQYYQKIYEIDVQMEQFVSMRYGLVDQDYNQLTPTEVLFLNEFDNRMASLQQEKLYWQDLVSNMQYISQPGTVVSGFERDIMKIPLNAQTSGGSPPQRSLSYETGPSIEKKLHLAERIEPSDSVSQVNPSVSTNSNTKLSKEKSSYLGPLDNKKKWAIVLGMILMIGIITTACVLVFRPFPPTSLATKASPTPHSPTRTRPPTSYVVSTLAGTGVAGFRDGSASTAQFSGPSGIAFDPSTGDIIVSDARNNRIRRISKGLVSTVAGNGTVGLRDGTGTEAQFNLPEAVACSPIGEIFVADTPNNLIRIISPGLDVRTIPGNVSYPLGITIDGEGNLFIAEYNPSIITRIGRNNARTRFAGTPVTVNANDTSSDSSFVVISQVSFANDTLYVSDRESGRIRTVSSSGTLATMPGTFRLPLGVVVDSFGIIYVSEGNQISGLRPDGTKFLVAGSSTPGDVDGTLNTSFSTPRNMAIDSYGVIYVADQENHKIRVITPKWD